MTPSTDAEQAAEKAASEVSPKTGGVLLTVNGLNVSFSAGSGWAKAVSDVSLDVAEGEVLGLVGESGAGKSVTAKAILGLFGGDTATRVGGSVRFAGNELTELDSRAMQRVRGAGIGMIFQHPGASLNPVSTIGSQLLETLRLDRKKRRGNGRSETWKRTLALLSDVGFSQPDRIVGLYPHQLSGGFQQRAMIALALARRPSLLIADEPTSSLDVTAQAQILELLADLRRRYEMAVILISHDFSVISRLAERVTVMADGITVETGLTVEILDHPKHPATQRLVAAQKALVRGGTFVNHDLSPACVAPERRPLVEIENLGMTYPARSWRLRQQRSELDNQAALKGITLELAEGEALGLVGESGSGKTTFAHCLIRACEPTAGRIIFDGADITHLPESKLQSVRQQMTMVFQDPSTSLNPRQRVAQIMAAPLRTKGSLGHERFGRGSERSARILATLELVGLNPDHLDRFPGELSGGQRQRVGLARALVTKPRILICDEPFSSLDTVNRAALIGLLSDLRKQLGLTLLFIAHDLAVIRRVTDRVAVIDHGQIVELDKTERIFTDPHHDQTRRLIAAMLDGTRQVKPVDSAKN